MARKVELGAGIAAGVLGITTLLVLLFAPLVTRCANVTSSPCANVRYTSLVSTGLEPAAWIFLLGMIAVILIGAAGAIADAGFNRRAGVLALWGGAVFAFSGCSVAAHAAGLVYLPAVLAICLAAYAALLQRMKERRRLSMNGLPADTVQQEQPRKPQRP